MLIIAARVQGRVWHTLGHTHPTKSSKNVQLLVQNGQKFRLVGRWGPKCPLLGKSWLQACAWFILLILRWKLNIKQLLSVQGTLPALQSAGKTCQHLVQSGGQIVTFNPLCAKVAGMLLEFISQVWNLWSCKLKILEKIECLSEKA